MSNMKRNGGTGNAQIKRMGQTQQRNYGQNPNMNGKGAPAPSSDVKPNKG